MSSVSLTKTKGRILCLTSNFPRWEGDSTTPFVKQLSDDLSDLGWKIDILAPHAPGALKKETMGELEVTRFQYFWPATQQTVCYQGGALINLRKNFCNKLKLPFLVLAEFIATLNMLYKNEYKLIHAHWILPQGFVAAIAGKIFNKPIVLTVHGGDVFGLKGKLLNSFKGWSLQRAKAVTTNSQFTTDATYSITRKIQKLEVIPMGIDISPLSNDQQIASENIEKSYRKNRAPLLIFVGRLIKEKGVDDLIKAVAMLQNDLPGTSAIIAGEGQDRNQFEELSKKLTLDEYIHFTGWIAPEDVKTHIAAGDFFVGPSKTAKNGWKEAQGLTFLEAMAVGTVVIASDTGGIKESVIDGQTGFLVKENSPEKIKEIILKMYSKPEELQKINKNALNNLSEKFSSTRSSIHFSQLFEQVTH